MSEQKCIGAVDENTALSSDKKTEAEPPHPDAVQAGTDAEHSRAAAERLRAATLVSLRRSVSAVARARHARRAGVRR